MFYPTLLSRRDALKTTACGFGYLALAGMLQQAAADEARQSYLSPIAPKSPHFAPRAKRVIFLFMQGGPSHVDTFDYKPKLATDDGKSHGRGKLMASPFTFSRHGQSGLYVSELFPSVAQHADSLCVLNGMHCDNPAHPQATIQLHTGSARFVRPSMGSWVLYGLGTMNADLPGFITINPVGPVGAQNYGAGFLPAAYEGTRIDGGRGRSMPNLSNPSMNATQQRRHLDLVQGMNRDMLKRTGQNQQIEGLIESYELGFRMQSAVPDVMDLSKESRATLDLYGIGGGKPSDGFGRQCLLARRYAEAGVRFIEVSHGNWDQHNNLVDRLKDNCAATDAPIAGLLTDLKQRGMLEDTLVMWGGEFGRTPTNQGGARDGRDHNNRGYSMWLAGGGTRGGIAHGSTDDYGAESVSGKVHVHDLHATILHLLGLDHERLTYRYAGRDFRLTDVYGNVAHEVVA